MMYYRNCSVVLVIGLMVTFIPFLVQRIIDLPTTLLLLPYLIMMIIIGMITIGFAFIAGLCGVICDLNKRLAEQKIRRLIETKKFIHNKSGSEVKTEVLKRRYQELIP